MIHLCTPHPIQVYEMVSGSLLHSVLFDFGLSSVTLDLAGQWIFVGASNGKIFQVDLQSKVRGQFIITVEPPLT